jgi:hypothetical protein
MGCRLGIVGWVELTADIVTAGKRVVLGVISRDVSTRLGMAETSLHLAHNPRGKFFSIGVNCHELLSASAAAVAGLTVMVSAESSLSFTLFSINRAYVGDGLDEALATLPVGVPSSIKTRSTGTLLSTRNTNVPDRTDQVDGFTVESVVAAVLCVDFVSSVADPSTSAMMRSVVSFPDTAFGPDCRTVLRKVGQSSAPGLLSWSPKSMLKV